MKLNEYSVAYQYETEEDLALLTNDFLPFLDGLHTPENFLYAKEKLDDELFEHFFAPELLEAKALPADWDEKLTVLLKSLRDGSVSCSEIDGVFGARRRRAAYQASYNQALVFLMGDVYKNNPDKPEPKPYVPVLDLLEKPYKYTPFKAASR